MMRIDPDKFNDIVHLAAIYEQDKRVREESAKSLIRMQLYIYRMKHRQKIRSHIRPGFTWKTRSPGGPSTFGGI
jgi:hypothetical protein